ncbi:hypothetical protein CVT24_010307 [Panaeolus cyanescens]|uniref:Uncharacterized protein n=1 Tax=Panaeolus cyanescens TaxID=181874 RepID=A0A409VCN4_9AGAR|nr:hypothetical protein CVT24_010307 [Panaeolus cyanescens]
MSLRSTTFIGLSIASLAYTWFYMFKYLEWSFNNYESKLQSPPPADHLVFRVAEWTRHTGLFEEAWAAVNFHPLRWWWSESLCLYTTGVWTIFIAVEGHRHKIKRVWAYMLLGQLVAISVASNLFYLALLVSSPPPTRNKPTAVKPRVWISVLLSLATVAVSPFTSDRSFLPNLLIMHTLIFLSIIPNYSPIADPVRHHPYSLRVSTLYRIAFLVSAIIRMRTARVAAAYLAATRPMSKAHIISAATSVLYSHPAMSSIGWDVIWTSISFVVWVLVRPTHPSDMSKARALPFLSIATPLASIAITAPYVLRFGEAVDPSADGNVKAE